MSDLQFIGACLRRVNAHQWEALTDGGHQPVGVAKVDVYSDRVRVHYSDPVAKVVTFAATVDESFAAAGVRCGASVGLSYADIYFYMGTPQAPVDPRLLSRASANAWISGVFIAR